jgi:hypothetical protein
MKSSNACPVARARAGSWLWRRMGKTLGLGLAALAWTASPAAAEGLNPGSLLVYPEFDRSPGRNTLLTVTNTHASASVRVRLVFVSPPATEGAVCNKTDQFRVLTPQDTWTLLVSTANTSGSQGFAYLYAIDNLSRGIGFDWLIGDDLVLDSVITCDYAVLPLSFRSRVGQGALTDVNGDGDLDLDDDEYDLAPDRILIPRFMGQSASFSSDLILISLSGGIRFETIVDLLVFNDNEVVLSSQTDFRCWRKVGLSTLSGIFSQTFLATSTNDNSNEIVGSPAHEAGWMIVDGNLAQSQNTVISDPAILAVLVENTGVSAGAEIPFIDGRQVGNLFPSSNSGQGP